MQKYSRQREIIRRHLSGRMDHPTAEMIYTSLKAQDPKLSLGTVYRNLSLLTDLGEIRRIPSVTGPDRYDGNCSEHYHFLCRSCGKIFDLYPAASGDLEQLVGSWQQGSIEKIVLNVYGTCRNCGSIQSAKATDAAEI